MALGRRPARDIIGIVLALTYALFTACLGIGGLIAAWSGVGLSDANATMLATLGGGMLGSLTAIAAGRRSIKDGDADE